MRSIHDASGALIGENTTVCDHEFETKENCWLFATSGNPSVSRYFTGDVSWLWDIDFEMLGHENIHEIVLAGAYVNDLAARFSYTDIPSGKIRLFEDIPEAVDYLNSARKEYIYTITCFSDKEKFLSKVEEV